MDSIKLISETGFLVQHVFIIHILCSIHLSPLMSANKQFYTPIQIVFFLTFNWRITVLPQVLF